VDRNRVVEDESRIVFSRGFKIRVAVAPEIARAIAYDTVADTNRRSTGFRNA